MPAKKKKPAPKAGPRLAPSAREGKPAAKAPAKAPAKGSPAAPAKAKVSKRPLTAHDILSASDALAKKAKKPKKVTAKTLGVYDADRDILDQYLHEVSKTPLLTQPQEIAIARLVQAGDQDAMQELVKRNLRFVISVAKKYQNRGTPLT